MSVSEHERHQLFTWFEEHMGSERAVTMMSLLPPVGWGDVATHRDLELLEARVDARFDQFEARIEVKLGQLMRTSAPGSCQSGGGDRRREPPLRPSLTPAPHLGHGRFGSVDENHPGVAGAHHVAVGAAG